ncbi:MAG: NAD(P)H-binding protein [Roseivirga sp.]|nr:NAD(P)H-binding protein [Roseivirga sp.]
MKILLLGATGRTGSHILTEALKRGYEVHALVRDPSKVKIQSIGLVLFTGNPENRMALAKAIEGCDAVVSALNISRVSDFPWARLRTPVDFLENMLTHLIELMSDEQIKRLVLTSAWGVGDSRKEIPGWFRWFIDNSNVGKAYSQHEIQENLLRNSNLDWTAVRPVGLTNRNKIKELVVSEQGKPRPRLTISRKHTAQFMLNCLEEASYIRATPVISEK